MVNRAALYDRVMPRRAPSNGSTSHIEAHRSDVSRALEYVMPSHYDSRQMMNQGRRRPVTVCAGLLIVINVMVACSSSKAAPPSSGTSAATTPAAMPMPRLWGDLKPIVSVKELMRDMLDPAADNIFDAVKIVFTKKGAVETVPRTEKDCRRPTRTGTRSASAR